MRGDLWLAVGDETGDWDNHEQKQGFLGVALVMAKVNDWNIALYKTIKEKMNQPLMNLPKKARKSQYHHVMEALQYWQRTSNSPSGEFLLENRYSNNLQQELFTNLRWLATHPRLITIGAYGKAEVVWSKLNLAKDPAQALGHAYALLSASVMPFLGEKDTLLVAPGLRSIEKNHIANIRANISSSNNNNNNNQRIDDNARGMIANLLDESQKMLKNYKAPFSKKIDSGVFDKLLKQYFPNKLLDKQTLNGIADMGAALMTLSKNTKGSIHLVDPNNTWKNVKFFKFEDLLA